MDFHNIQLVAMVNNNWILVFVVIICVYKFDARQNEQAEVVKFYDDDNNLHLINLAVPDTSALFFLKNRRMLDIDPRFWLYTRRNKNNYEELHIDALDNITYFNPFCPLIVVTHGWMNSGLGKSSQLIKNAYLNTSDVNVIVVDWKTAASFEDYVTSAFSTILVAEAICDLLLALSEKYNLSGGKMHLIGHSLGAHVVGLAGTKLRRKLFIVGRVTGLDPARPLFEFPQIFEHISRVSAEFVDIIHTDAGVLGYESSIGHADFYPNGGFIQPHCCDVFQLSYTGCQHSCAFIYFMEAIQGRKYISTRCDSYLTFLIGLCDNNDKQIMGLPHETARGSYFPNIPR